MRYRVMRVGARLGVHLAIIAGAVIVMLPFFWTVSTALKDRASVFAYPPRWLPDPVMWSNFAEAHTILPFALFYKNTLLVSLVGTVGALASSSLVAYGFARLEFRGRDILFLLVLATIMLPYYVVIIPQYMLFRKLGWVNTFLPLIVPSFFGGGAFNIFLLRQFFLTVPRELDDAARIDGCTTWGVYYRIMLPLAKPALTAVAIFSFLGRWEDFMGPLIFLHSQERWTVSLALNAFRGQFGTEWSLMMAAALVAMIPPLALFFLAQRFFIQGVVLTGVKG